MKYLLLVSAFFYSLLGYTEEPLFTDEEKKMVEQYFQASFGSLGEKDIEVAETEIPRLMAVYVSGRVIYFNIDTKLMILGEIYNQQGVSLTKKEIAKRALAKLDSLPPSSIVINKGKGYPKIIEFSDPDCPYCLKAQQFFLSENAPKVERHVYFDTRIHPDAKKKVVHIFCSDDQEKAFHEVFARTVTEFTSCVEGIKAAEIQQQASISMSVSGTPTFFVGENLIRGFNKKQLLDHLQPQN
jgi:thiol:disulfide interchange protein DsbC